MSTATADMAVSNTEVASTGCRTTDKYKTILLFGAPGAGKGTQGKILGTIPQFYHHACGDVFRNLTIDNALGRIFLEYSSRGELVPDEHTVRLWQDNINAMRATGRFHPERDTLVLDGIPRTVHQAEMLSDTLDVRAIFNLTCSDRTKLVERLQRRALRENRLDDANLEVIGNRLEAYERETKPVIDYYGRPLVHVIDSTQTPINVLRDILRVIAQVKLVDGP
ncbi:MAG: nucleoside monophosphate kinase [Verrucomicrobiales bacterium]|nr:nucleoside monophosphate kinase [Verrucomicrobiales bacterium]